MRYFPINLDIRDKPVVLVGGGAVAARKCLALLAAGARVTVIAPELDQGLGELRTQGEIRHLARQFAPGDLAGAFLALAVTDSAEVNAAVAGEASARGILADIADAPELGAFTLPALLRRGDLLIAVSTGGKSPALARRIRRELEERYGPEYGTAVMLLGKLREKLLTEKGNSAYNKELFNELVDHDLPALIRNHSTAEIDHLLTKIFGPGFTLSGLGVAEKDTE
ncbi:MAG: bifunctional precorrin-2 dehydrogenase/sirohydrochlorin ferrochelatase [Geobacteraceae bacterium]|nr:bifunctional precorrin-2 dehydrogenase/sirohydrochlorin ferrochelatase [Geobacteraceae bacterium]